jgi:Benzoyl-CoA reductase/2-hydroxyglutaryl-CoA dehydratase subunit, BcrC/BadD/HgdB
VRTGILERLAEAAGDPWSYAAQWKRRTGRAVVGILPMNFPAELVHAAGALPLLVQQSREPITVGNAIFPTFYCGYSRSLVDQAARGRCEVLDALLFVDNCVQIIGAADVIRLTRPELPTRYFQLNSSVGDGDSVPTAERAFRSLRMELADLVGPVTDAAVTEAIALFNENRRLLREIRALRNHTGVLSSRQMQTLITSSMVMDRAEHTQLLTELLAELTAAAAARPAGVRVHLSGHMCHPPHPDLLDMIEESGATVVNDDLYHGLRYIATDVRADGDPLAALAQWYVDRDATVPCPTRVLSRTSWATYLADQVRATGADGVVMLMPKFCEPQMYHHPQLCEALDKQQVPYLLIETEHEGMPMEALRTRIESFLELIALRG